jgi:hypothetical protein
METCAIQVDFIILGDSSGREEKVRDVLVDRRVEEMVEVSSHRSYFSHI